MNHPAIVLAPGGVIGVGAQRFAGLARGLRVPATVGGTSGQRLAAPRGNDLLGISAAPYGSAVLDAARATLAADADGPSQSLVHRVGWTVPASPRLLERPRERARIGGGPPARDGRPRRHLPRTGRRRAGAASAR